jgi:hypothetical protein
MHTFILKVNYMKITFIKFDIHFWAPSQNCEKGLLASSCLSVCLSAWNSSAYNKPIFIAFDI